MWFYFKSKQPFTTKIRSSSCFHDFPWIFYCYHKSSGNFVKIYKHIDGHFYCRKKKYLWFNISKCHTPSSYWIICISKTKIHKEDPHFLSTLLLFLLHKLNFNQSQIYRMILSMSIFDIYYYLLPFISQICHHLRVTSLEL